MNIIHKIETNHQNADELFKLSFSMNKDKKESALSMIIISNDENFLKKIVENFEFDRIFFKIITKLKTLINEIENHDDNWKIIYQSYKMNSSNDLLYLRQKLDSNKLCISNTCHRQILQYVHDEHVHEEIYQTHDLFRRSMFMLKMTIKIKKYVIACSICQLFKFFKQIFYKKLQSIEFFTKSLTKFNLNFIVILSMISTENNTIMSRQKNEKYFIEDMSSRTEIYRLNW